MTSRGREITDSVAAKPEQSAWDHTTHREFYEYYANESESEATLRRFGSLRAVMLRVAGERGMVGPFDVADIGCGAGTQCRMWATLGHRVHGVDVNEALIRLGRERAAAQGLDIRFETGSATALPWADTSMDMCLMPELLEHVADWQSCLNEAARVLRPGGLFYVSTTNVLCPVQQEFNLPLYSWYPGPVKRYCERLAVTTRPALANFAKYPAVHWFSYYGLRDYLAPKGFRCMDRFDLIDIAGRSTMVRRVISVLRHLAPLRFLGHVATPSTYLVAAKSS